MAKRMRRGQKQCPACKKWIKGTRAKECPKCGYQFNGQPAATAPAAEKPAKNGYTITIPQIKAVTQTVKAVGGVAKVNELLGLVKDVGGTRKFKDLLDAMGVSEPAEAEE